MLLSLSVAVLFFDRMPLPFVKFCQVTLNFLYLKPQYVVVSCEKHPLFFIILSLGLLLLLFVALLICTHKMSSRMLLSTHLQILFSNLHTIFLHLCSLLLLSDYFTSVYYNQVVIII